MFEKVGRVAHRAATNVSRRQFLGRFGAGAMALAAAIGGVLALRGTASAAPRVCGPGGDPGLCAGQEVNARCGGRLEPNARCRRIRGSTDCVCR